MFINYFVLLTAATAGTFAIPQRFRWGATTSTPAAVTPQPASTSAAPPASSSTPPADTPPASSAIADAGAASVPSTEGGAATGGESHQITIVNNCGEGQPLFAYAVNRAGQPVQGSVTINGPVDSGIAWMDGTKDNCGFDGTGCGFMEFTIANSMMNSADYSLLTAGLGEHHFKYAMDFKFTGECTAGPGKCQSGDNCPGAYTGTDTFSGDPTTCGGQNVGIHITFC
ncbi:hypothetical protein I203_101694 [Kwoniella mangroviensis CBS 8507]|uniref:uncharacterized protein n=1 Tax=Kwoniella mangroviensis CBS 8507 TaxID=1296122 RepID=UPI003022E648